MGADKRRRTPPRATRSFARGEAPKLPTAIVHPQAEADAADGQFPPLLIQGWGRACPSRPRLLILLLIAVSGASSSLAAIPNVVTSWGGTSANPTGARPKRSTANYSSAQPGRYSLSVALEWHL